MTNTELAHIVASVIAVLDAQKKPSVKASRAVKATKNDRLASKDQSILRGFARKGIKNVVLMDRSDRSKPFNVKPFRAWTEEGRVVKKGEHGVRGLFHVSQTEELPKAETKVDQPKADAPKVEVMRLATEADRAEISRLATKFRLAKQDARPTV